MLIFIIEMFASVDVLLCCPVSLPRLPAHHGMCCLSGYGCVSGGYPAGCDDTRHCSCLKGKDDCWLSPRLARLPVCIMGQVVSMLSCVHMDVVHNKLFVVLNGKGHTYFG